MNESDNKVLTFFITFFLVLSYPWLAFFAMFPLGNNDRKENE